MEAFEGDPQNPLNQSIIPEGVWGKLNSISRRAKNQELKNEQFTIGRTPNNSYQIQDQKISGTHCKISMRVDEESGKMIVSLEDTSSNGTYYNGEKLSKGQTRDLKNGDEIHLLKEIEGAVDSSEEIGFIFVLLKDYSRPDPSQQQILNQSLLKSQEKERNSKKRAYEEITVTKEELEVKIQEEKVMQQKISSMADQFDCGICYMTMHQAVSLMPCLHTFCGGCFSDWMTRAKDCPSCREPVTEVKKNSLINNLIENYHSLNPNLKRDPKDLENLEKLNIFKNESVKIEQPKKEEPPKPAQIPHLQPIYQQQPQPQFQFGQGWNLFGNNNNNNNQVRNPFGGIFAQNVSQPVNFEERRKQITEQRQKIYEEQQKKRREKYEERKLQDKKKDAAKKKRNTSSSSNSEESEESEESEDSESDESEQVSRPNARQRNASVANDNKNKKLDKKIPAKKLSNNKAARSHLTTLEVTTIDSSSNYSGSDVSLLENSDDSSDKQKSQSLLNVKGIQKIENVKGVQKQNNKQVKPVEEKKQGQKIAVAQIRNKPVLAGNDKKNQEEENKQVIKVRGAALFNERGALPAGKKECKNCTEMSADMFLCKKDQQHLKCTNCEQLFPERNQFDQMCYLCDRNFCNLYWECPKRAQNPLAQLQEHKINLNVNRNYSNADDWPEHQKVTIENIMKVQKLTPARLAQFIYQNHLKNMVFRKRFVNQGENDEVRVLAITPVCKMCSMDIHSQMLLQYIEIKFGDKKNNGNEEEKKKEERENQVNNNGRYVKPKKMNFK
eukprot:403367860